MSETVPLAGPQGIEQAPVVQKSETEILVERLKQYEGEIMRLRNLADELSWALAKAVINSGPPKG